jgi:hypothetical protein
MNYTTSKDYEELWRLVQDGKEIICMDGDGYLGYAHITEDGETRIRERNGSTLIGDSENKLEFIIRCERNELEFLPPTSPEKENTLAESIELLEKRVTTLERKSNAIGMHSILN